MANLYQVVLNQNIEPQDVNQLVVIDQQPSGGTETGHYFLAGSVYANGALVSCYIPSRSRGSTPVSVTIDETDQVHTGGINATPSTGALTSGGFQVYSLSTTGPNVNARAGGLYTLQY